MSLLTGAQIGGYTFGPLLGQGAMGEVYRGEQGFLEAACCY